MQVLRWNVYKVYSVYSVYKVYSVYNVQWLETGLGNYIRLKRGQPVTMGAHAETVTPAVAWIPHGHHISDRCRS